MMKKPLILFAFLLCFAFVVFDANATPPTVQAKYLAFSAVTSNSVTVYWTRGNGTNRVVVIRTDNNWTATDAILTDNGPTFADVNGNLSTAPQVGTTGSKVIDVMGPAGTPNYLRETNLSNLAPGTTYYIKVYEFNVDGSYWDYNNASDVNNPRSFTTTASYSGGLPSGLSIAPWSEGGQLSWSSDGTGAAGYLLSVYNNGSSSWAFQNRDIGKPSDKKYQVFGLSNNTSYTYYLYSYDASGNVSSTSTSATATTLTNPAITSASYTPGHGSAPYYNNVGIGCDIVVTVTAQNNQLGLLPNGTQTINGINVTSTFTDNRNGTYTLKYTVASGHTNIDDATTDLPLSFNFQDGNSISFASAYSPANNLQAPGVDATPPSVSSINRQSPLAQCTNANTVTFRVTFSEDVNTSSVAISDFTLTSVSGSGGSASITAVTPVLPVGGGAQQYDVTVDVTGVDRQIRLDFTGSVNDMAYGCPNASTTTFNTGETYYVDHTNPSGTVSTPSNAACYNSSTVPASFSGTASDSWVGSSPCGLTTVEVSLWKDNDTDGTFSSGDVSWNGSSWVSTQTWNTATGTSSWTWTHGATFSDGKYYVQIRVSDAAGNTWTMSPSVYFIYDNTPPTAGGISSPTAGACWNSGNHTITWTSATDQNLSNTVSIEYSTDNGATWTNIVTSTPNTGSYTWNIPPGINSPTNQGRIRITFSDCANNTSSITSAGFTFDDTPPTNNSTPVLASSCLLTGSSVNITWDPADISDPNLSSLTLQYSTDGGTNWTNIATGLANSGTYNWNPLPTSPICSNNGRVRIVAVDCAGNQTYGNNSLPFTIDNLAITAQPQDTVLCNPTGSVTFTVTATSNCGTPSYQWQYSTSPSGLWTNVNNGTPTNASYSGANSNQLTVTSSSPGIPAGNYYYQCVVTPSCGGTNTVNSNSAKLQVVTPLAFGATYPTNPSAQTIGQPITLTFNYTGGTTNVTYKLYKYTNSSCSAGQTLITSGNVTSSPFTISYGTVDCNTAGYYNIVIEDDCPSTVSGNCFQIQALAAEPTTQASNISGGRTRTTISLIWTSGNGNGRLVAATQGSTSYTGHTPVDGTTYTGANTNWQYAAWFTSSPTKLLYNGTGSSAYITGLTASTWYTFRIFEYNYDNGCASTSINYNTNTASDNPRPIKTTAKDADDEEVLRAGNFGMTPIWPNPVEDVLQFDLLIQKAANFKVEIIGMDGRTLFTHEYNYDNVATTVMIALDKKIFAPGAYMLRVSALGETLQQPFIFLP